MFVQLAQTYIGQNITGWLCSEKLDGMRAIWDGGITRGQSSAQIPWANSLKSVRESTGLWSRYGIPIPAPDWWIEKLPKVPLDGELYLGRGRFQELMSTVKAYVSDRDWADVKYHVFDAPWEFFEPRKLQWGYMDVGNSRRASRFHETLTRISDYSNEIVVGVEHRIIEDLEKELDLVLDAGGEGLMLRNPNAIWVPKRSKNVLKVKGFFDDEATVIGINIGKGKYLGMMGSLSVRWGSTEFEVGGGFTDAERELGRFRIGDTITFKYREVTDQGVPKEARYLRSTL